MSARGGGELESRVLVCTPVGRDAALVGRFLEEQGWPWAECPTDGSLCDELTRGAGTAIIAEEALSSAGLDRLVRLFDEQPDWSDLHLLVFTKAATRTTSINPRIAAISNITILERPIRIHSLLTVVRTALRSRQRQYRSRNLLERLSEADRKKDQFLAMLGHELRNPLAASLTALDVLRTDGDGSAAALAVLDRQLGNLGRLVDDLLDVSRVLAGKIVLDCSIVDACELARRAIEEVAGRAARKQVELDVTLPVAPVHVSADALRLNQVLVNLLTNAIKYTPTGGRTSMTVRAVDGAAQIEVRDEGIGIAAADLETIFEPFFQVDASLDRADGGLGLGLPLVVRLVELHGGTCRASSDGIGHGASFIVELPQVAAPIAAAPTAEGDYDAIQAVRHALHLLLVEDNDDLRELLTLALSNRGYTVAACASAEAGLEHILAQPPHAALVDVGLPGMNGYELASRVRNEGHQLVLVAMTGYGQALDRQRALAAGFDEHLTKPVAIEAIAALIERLHATPRQAARVAGPARGQSR